MMHKLKIDLKGTGASISGNSAPVLIDGNAFEGVAGFEVSGRAGEYTRATIDLYIRDFCLSANTEILINAIPVSEEIGFKILQSFLEYFLPRYGYTEKINSIIASHQS